METRKYIFVIAADGSALAELCNTLDRDDFEITVCDSTEKGLELAQHGAHLSLLAVDGALIADHDGFICGIRDSQRDLPVIWCHEAEAKPRFSVDPPAQLFGGPLDADRFVEAVLKLVFNDYYPNAVIHGLVSSGNSVLARSCETGVEVGVPWLKASECMIGEVHAYLAFFSDNVSGQILTSGSIDVLSKLGELLGFDPEEGQRQVAIDMAGEIANQALGRMKSICGDVLAGIRMGVPVVWTATGVKSQFASEKPNIAVELQCMFGPVYMEFGFTSMAVEDKNAGLGDYIPSGDVELF